MPLWRFVPIADETDSAWQDRFIWHGVVVRASTAALARVIAEEAEDARVGGAVGNETASPGGGFSDPNLYWVERLSPEEARAYGDPNGPEGIVARGEATTPALSVFTGANATGQDQP